MRLENPSNWVQVKCSQPVPTQLGFNQSEGNLTTTYFVINYGHNFVNFGEANL